MDMAPLKPEWKAQLEWERQDHDESVAALLQGNADVETGRTRPAEDVYHSLRLRHGL